MVRAQVLLFPTKHHPQGNSLSPSFQLSRGSSRDIRPHESPRRELCGRAVTHGWGVSQDPKLAGTKPRCREQAMLQGSRAGGLAGPKAEQGCCSLPERGGDRRHPAVLRYLSQAPRSHPQPHLLTLHSVPGPEMEEQKYRR